MDLTIFGRFHALQGQEAVVAAAIAEVTAASRAEPGCLGIAAYRSIQDGRLFYIHSRWADEAAFEIHAGLPHTVRFIDRIAPLIDHPLDVARTRPLHAG